MPRPLKILLATLAALFLFCGLPATYLLYRLFTTGMTITSTSPTPGASEFQAADAQIGSFSATPARGTTPADQTLAASYAKLLQEILAQSFPGYTEPTYNPTKGNVLVYCHTRPDSCVFLVNIPELHQRQGTTRDKLSAMAWDAARQVLSDHHQTPATLAVALRGTLLYGPTMTGSPGGPPALTGSNQLDMLYPFFAPASPSTMPAP